jgi:hypothetical protein
MGKTKHRDGNSSLAGATLWFSDDEFHPAHLLVGFFDAIINLTELDQVGKGNVFLFTYTAKGANPLLTLVVELLTEHIAERPNGG